MKPRLLDLFCGAGGAAMGYHRAGFDVIGVDIKPQLHYPFEFHRADAMEWLEQSAWYIDKGYDAIHASPPCQAYTRASKLRAAQGSATSAPDLIGPVRELLKAIGLPYVIENVEGAPMEGFVAMMCGSAFGLDVRRHRLFESNVMLLKPQCLHDHRGRPVGVYHRMGDDIPSGGRTARTLAEASTAMGIDWMTWDEIKEAVPPAYTEHIGLQLIKHLEARAA